jgi:hypothetical protein
MTKDNIVNLVPPTDTDKLLNSTYIITTLDDEYTSEGFAIFTSQHVAIMRDTGNGPIPVLLVPLAQLKALELVEDTEEDAPF